MPTMYVPNDIWLNPINEPDEKPTQCGCCWDEYHHSELEWYEPTDDFICADCKHEEDIMRQAEMVDARRNELKHANI